VQNYFDTIDLPLYSADFHYFRIAREKWELMLARLGQLGVQVITITVPWSFHEFSEGTIDLTGATSSRRDVTGLLDLCAAFNVRCLLNIGPYADNRGILNNGLPHWLQETPANSDGAFLSATTRWYQAVSKALVNQQWPDGPIVALQVESEPAQGQQLAYSDHLTEVRWPIWLRKRYDGIEALNAAYDTTYGTVSEVPFSQSRSQELTPLEKDVQEFLKEFHEEKESSFNQILVEAGWHLPIFSIGLPVETRLPAIQSYEAANLSDSSIPGADRVIVNLQDAIQVEPDPTDIATGSVWAKGAPIRSDGSVRRMFWRIRQLLWTQQVPEISQEAGLTSVSFETGGLLTAGQDMELKHSLTKGTKPITFDLRLNGELLISRHLSPARGRLSGFYLTEDDTGQTDMVIYLNEPSGQLSGFLLTYLRLLLIAQAETLSRCATLAAALGKMLSSSPAGPEIAQADISRPTSYTLAEARRGLGEADKILRRAMESIGGLEAGFDIMLGRSGTNVPEPAATPPAIRAEIFEGRTREILIRAGQACEKHVPQLLVAAEDLQSTISQVPGFTIEQYQQGYEEALTVAQNVREALLEVVAQLRLEMAAEQLPLVAWRIHNQIQEVAESLRWGVLRG
jgi:hypothetical protein